MFKVECPGCKAPYQVDERRVPPTGLKMRCPKCGTSFQVEPPPADPRGTSPNPVLESPAGGSAPGEGAPGKPPLPRKKPAVKGTMIGMAPASALPRPAAQLPRPAAPAPAAPGALDLPAARGAPPAADLPAVRAPAAPAPSRGGPPRPGQPTMPHGSPPIAARAPAPVDVDLPAPRAPMASDPFGDLDFPSPVAAERTLPGHADLPAPAGHDLPAPAGHDLPAFAGARAPLDLPSVHKVPPRQGAGRTDVDLPARAAGSAGGFELDLDLPSPSLGVDLPSPAMGVDLPSVSQAVGLPAAFGELDLPIVGADLPSAQAAGLPARGEAGLPMPQAAGLPSRATAGLPMAAAGLPSAVDDPFGSPADPFGAAPGEAADPFGAAPAPDPFGAAPDPFGASGTETFGTPAAAHPFGAPATDGALGGAPDPFGGGAHAPFGGAAAAEPEGGEFAPPQESEDGQEVVRQGGGGTAYGEVNLEDGGGGGGGGGVSLEGDLPSAGAEATEFGEAPVPGAAPAPTRTRAAAAQPGSAVAEIQAKRRRRRLRVVVATVVTTALAGGALTLVPAVGPFGAHFVIDQLRRGEYERLLAAASDTSRRHLGSDTYPDAEKAMAEVEAAAARAKRYQPLAAYTAFIGFSRTLRFGAESAVYARAKVALEELSEATEVDKLDLARATKAAADGELARARQSLERLAKLAPRDVDVAIVRAEVEFRSKDAEAALRAWTAAAALEKTPRTGYGLARAKVLAGDLPTARKLAEEVLKQAPNHAGARLLVAEAAWRSERSEAIASKLLDDMLKNAASAGPEERIDAHTLLGEIHLNRGRMTQAEQAFGEAIKLAELIKVSAKASRALSGFGEALFRAGRYSQAIARFKAAAQADPDDAVALVGVAKSSLQLERLEEAKDMLAKLRKSHPKRPEVAYWHGRVQEALGNRKEAEVAYKDAITEGRNDPETVHAYIALATVMSQQGMLDEANRTLSEAQKVLPASPALHKALGRLAMTQGRYADGLAAYQRALEQGPDDVEARFLVGTALVRQREFDKALEIFDAVAKIDRDFPGLALERGILFQESGRTEEALREYEAALAKAPNDPDLILKVGCGKADAGNGAEAEKLLRRVLEQRQNSAETHFCLGRALMGKHDLNDAIKALERAIQIDPNQAPYHYFLGRACNEAGFIAKASVALKRALELDQGLADAYWQRGVLRVRQGRAKDAIEDLTKALTLRPSRFEAHSDLALAYYDLGREELALSEWQRAISANPKEPTWRFHYGKLLSIRLQHAAAAEQLGKAIELAAAESPAPQWLSEAHRVAAQSLGNSPGAIPHWQAFMKMGAVNSPYRSEAVAALKRLGAPWEE